MMQMRPLKCVFKPRDGDFIAWHYARNGVFSIKSAYNLVLNLMERTDDSGQSSGRMNEDWRSWNVIWKANVPQKIRIFA